MLAVSVCGIAVRVGVECSGAVRRRLLGVVAALRLGAERSCSAQQSVAEEQGRPFTMSGAAGLAGTVLNLKCGL